MYIQIGIHTYRTLRNISFVPEVDITGTSVPINELSVDIITADEIELGMQLELYDDVNTLFARYTIVYAERTAPRTVTVRARSDVAMLDAVTLPATMYDTTAPGVLVDVFGSVSTSYSLHSSFQSVAVKGFCPEQTARERLAWLCLVLGAYVKSCFNSTIEILPLDESDTLIPLGRTFWRPSITYNDYVISFSVIGYSFTQGTPQTTDQWVEDDGGVTYIVRKTGAALTPDPDTVPEGAIGTAMQVGDVMLVNQNNISAVLARLSSYYFTRQEVDLDVINNGEYVPGQRVTVQIDDATLMTGYIQSAAFRFGTQARSTLHVVVADIRPSRQLIVKYMYNRKKLGEETFLLPVGYSYSLENPYFDVTLFKNRRIYRPLTANVEGTIIDGENTATVYYDIALELEYGTLTITSVDDIELDVDGQDYVGVIS